MRLKLRCRRWARRKKTMEDDMDRVRGLGHCDKLGMTYIDSRELDEAG
jgi:hypothetical protein